MSYRSFFNEARRKILIGVSGGLRGEMRLVRIRIQGPNSVAENEVTEKEAEELHSALGEYLTSRNTSLRV